VNLNPKIEKISNSASKLYKKISFDTAFLEFEKNKEQQNNIQKLFLSKHLDV
jgi:hypothetical protein